MSHEHANSLFEEMVDSPSLFIRTFPMEISIHPVIFKLINQSSLVIDIITVIGSVASYTVKMKPSDVKFYLISTDFSLTTSSYITTEQIK